MEDFSLPIGQDQYDFSDADISDSSYSMGHKAAIPLNSSSPQKVFPQKRSIFTPRTAKLHESSPERFPQNRVFSHSGSPLKHRKDSFQDLSMNANIQNFVNQKVPQMKSSNIDLIDDIDLLVKETHRAINHIPKSIVGDEFEEYQRSLTGTIQKLTQRCQDLAVENDQLKSNDNKIIINELNSKITSLSKSNQMYKEEVAKQSDEFMKMLNENNELKHKNELLRTKLEKYRNLCKSSRPEVIQTYKKNERSSEIPQKEELLRVYNEMAAIMKRDRKVKRDINYKEEPVNLMSDTEDTESPDLLKKFQDILEQHKKLNSKTERPVESPVVPAAQYESNSLNLIIQKNNELMEKLLRVVEQKSEIPVSADINNKAEAQTTSTPKQQDVVLKCYLCFQNLHEHNGSAGVYEGKEKSIRRKCERCSRTASERTSSAESNSKFRSISPRIDLMGEYKWSI